MRAYMRGVYFISAADHTSVKRRHRPTVPPVQENGDGAGTPQSKYVQRLRSAVTVKSRLWHRR